jgi:hypothetical protein
VMCWTQGAQHQPMHQPKMRLEHATRNKLGRAWWMRCHQASPAVTQSLTISNCEQKGMAYASARPP